MAAIVRYAASGPGPNVADETELRLLGDVSGKRVVELGITTPSNAIALASAGARTLAVDPSADHVTQLRRQAEQAEVTVQCHQSEISDLGFVSSASLDLVLATHTLQGVDDLARLLRQIHRVLKPDAAFVMSVPHPIASMLGSVNGQQIVQQAYGRPPARSISDLFMSMQRTNFAIDVMHELMPLQSRNGLVPPVLVVRARKLGV